MITFVSPLQVGTSGYMAPEVVLESVYSFNADSFSFGCMLWEMLTCGEEPFFPDLHNFGKTCGRLSSCGGLGSR